MAGPTEPTARAPDTAPAPDTEPPSWRSEDNRSPVLAPHTPTVPGPGTSTTNPHNSITIPNANTEITHLYLTFSIQPPSANTTLRAPTSPSSSSSSPPLSPSNAPPPPPPPDLTPFHNPLHWPPLLKLTILSLSSLATFLTAYTAGAYSPPSSLLLTTLSHTSSPTSILAGISTFCLGFALAPMVLAPFSEMNGRYPVFVCAGCVFVIFQAVCGVVRTLEGMLIARFFLGVGASVFSTMVGGVIADVWVREERNLPMAVFSGAVLCGTGMGPLVSAVMTERWGGDGDGEDGGEVEEGLGARWRWIFWHQVIMGAVLMAALVVLFRESRGSVLLSRKARVLNKWYEELEGEGWWGVWVDETGLLEEGRGEGDEEKGAGAGTTKVLKRIRWKVKEDEERASLTKMIGTSVFRPFHLLFTEPVVFFFSLWAAFAWGVLYLTFGSIPLVFKRQYGWNIEQAGRVFVAMIVGAILATGIGIWQEKMLHHPKWKAPPSSSPNPTAITNTTSNTTTSSTTEGSSSSASDTEGPNALPCSEPKPSFCPPSPSSSSSTRENPIWPYLRTHFPTTSPESRLYFTCLTSTLLPIGLFIFGFTARPQIHWIWPSIGIGIATMGILSVYLAVFNYLADTYHRYASSALAAQSFCRNILGGVFPLVTAPLFTNLGEGRAVGILGGVAVGLTAVPWVLVWCGEWVRGRSRFALQLEKD
ncbi:major facilitator superfamily domain-containing protein [Sordaria brevicollis]|uniref:Major facilitator superfamily domain-containing protein n=1 Tax=Sordaria brevicollis TaxID=83679 RepID=A0AAE0U2C9_SORBR|nr:major facilitator superfamily domain-containing protein [Sordaria brevicollis]